MSTSGTIGLATTLGTSTTQGGSYTNFAEVVDVRGPEVTIGKVDFTHYGTSGYKDFKPAGLKEVTDIEIDITYVTGTRTTLDGYVGTERWYKVTLPDTHTYVFPGFISKLGQETPNLDRVKLSVSITVTGAVTYA